MSVIKRLYNTFNRNSNNHSHGRISPQLIKSRKTTFSSYLEQDKVEVGFAKVYDKEANLIKDLSDEFIMIEIENVPTLTPHNIEYALSRPHFKTTSSGPKIRTLSLPSTAYTDSQYWYSFMQSMSELGSHCLRHDILLKDDFIDQEPFLYIGLPAIAIFDMVQRSCFMRSFPIVFHNGVTLDSRHCPLNGPVPFKLFELFKTRFMDLKLSLQEIALMKIKLLYSSGERDYPDSMQSNIEFERLAHLNAFIADIISTSIELTQLAYFKDNFEENVTKKILKNKY